jgi:hypothetical protein
MQKVEGSSPFIRFAEPAGNGGFSLEKTPYPVAATGRSGFGPRSQNVFDSIAPETSGVG